MAAAAAAAEVVAGGGAGVGVVDDAAPGPLVFPEQVFAIAFHPSQPVIASGLIDGHISLHGYSMDGNVCHAVSQPHQESCRGLQFNDDGSVLFSVSADRSLQVMDVATGQTIHVEQDAHEAPINAVQTITGQGSLVSGDDEGCVKLWDLRQRKPILSFNAHNDFISDLTYVAHKKTILATSGDGRLSAMNWKKGSHKISEENEDELLSIAVIKNCKKVVCGTQDGIIAVFNWGQWGDMVDRIPGHPKSIDALVAIDENTICTGSSDGLIRVVRVYPNSLLGIAGEHEDFPIEQLAVSADRALLASCSHDKTVKFWSLEAMFQETTEEEHDGVADAMQAGEAAAKGDDSDDAGMDADDDFQFNEEAYGPAQTRRRPGEDDFFADL